MTLNLQDGYKPSVTVQPWHVHKLIWLPTWSRTQTLSPAEAFPRAFLHTSSSRALASSEGSHAATITLNPCEVAAWRFKSVRVCVCIIDRLKSHGDQQCNLRGIYCRGLSFVSFTAFSVLGQINGNRGGKIKLMWSSNDCLWFWNTLFLKRRACYIYLFVYLNIVIQQCKIYAIYTRYIYSPYLFSGTNIRPIFKWAESDLIWRKSKLTKKSTQNIRWKWDKFRKRS